jgi:hypothetical protein
MALGTAVFAPPAQAASSVIAFDPLGLGGADVNDLAITSFAYLPGNVDSVNGGTITPASVGQNIVVKYEAILGSIGTTALTGNSNTASLNSVNGNTLVTTPGGTNNLNTQFVITAQFTETVTSVNTTTNVVTFGFSPTGTNSLNIYAQTSTNLNSASINNPNGTVNAYPLATLTTGNAPPNPSTTNSTLILSGQVTPVGFTSSFQNSTTPPVALNQHAGGSGDYAGITTVTGSGNTALGVNVGFANPNYFYGASPSVLSLAFNTISSGTPFIAVDPVLKNFDGTAPSIGAINGVSGPDFLFQSQANNSFSVPEPGSIVMVSIGLAVTGLASLRSVRRRKASSAA